MEVSDKRVRTTHIGGQVTSGESHARTVSQLGCALNCIQIAFVKPRLPSLKLIVSFQTCQRNPQNPQNPIIAKLSFEIC